MFLKQGFTLVQLNELITYILSVIQIMLFNHKNDSMSHFHNTVYFHAKIQFEHVQSGSLMFILMLFPVFRVSQNCHVSVRIKF